MSGMVWQGATVPGSPERANEDWVGTAPGAAVVLDGLSAPRGVGGCSHGTPWFVERLGKSLLGLAQDREQSLRQVLRAAISSVAGQHAGCDLDDAGTPSSTVAMVRVRPAAGVLEALVLADSPVVVDVAGRVEVVSDTSVESVAGSQRAAALAAPARSSAKAEAMAELVRVQRQLRNVASGYWVASVSAEAAEHALTASWPLDQVERVAAMSDGVSCLVQEYGAASWPQVLEMAQGQGVERVLSWVREVEDSDPDCQRWPRYKSSDDAALAFARVR